VTVADVRLYLLLILPAVLTLAILFGLPPVLDKLYEWELRRARRRLAREYGIEEEQ
jgi:hypothetical protein